ncbi:MAG: hypothetical protein UY35_C0005G0118 [Candidatus Saccharibacteria bacterium GW2011_GWC2_48_9]|nr:MAG: hypothetical protein UY35_C0005G0118 [Candidatus Saccharibacteria bacterium GW2011_GWC2_48_9]HCH34843.1 hypothetical protein [Candidatus Saccharibacteria bacterium]
MDNNVVLLAFFAAILIVAGIVLVIIVYTKGGSSLNQEKYRTKWLQIEHSLKKDQPASYHLSVLNADKLLDYAMKEAGYKGKTMGERLKAASPRLTNRNATWSAHKLRNQIAHEQDVSVSYDTTRRALASFKQALKDVGAI